MSWRAVLPKMLWLDRRFAGHKTDHAAPIIPGDDELAAYCEQYIVCDNDVETFCDDYRGETCSDDRQDSGTTSDRND